MRKFNSPGRKKRYIVVQWGREHHIMKWNGEKYSIIGERKSKELAEEWIVELYKADREFSRVKRNVKDLEKTIPGLRVK